VTWRGWGQRLRWLLIGGALGMLLLSLVLTLPLRWIDPPTSAYMWLDSHRRDRAVEHVWVDYERISEQLKLAVIAAEDQRFPEHHGFDWREIRQAVDEARAGERLRGASTLTQQLARNLYLWPGRGPLDRWLRKGFEAWLTGWLELTLPKRRILDLYLNLAEMAPAVYGAEAGSRHHFGVSADRLDAAQATALAAVLPNPAVYSVRQPSADQRERRAWIRRQARQLGGPAWLRRHGL
jgi:monofunctional biosynthetic peptidoglycan transglycosylase